MPEVSVPHGQRRVVLCDSNGITLGDCGVLEAHQHPGELHRAFSVLVFRNQGEDQELLIQRRSPQKLLFASHWANTCCSHPSPEDASVRDAAMNRLREECGFAVPLREVGSFVYRAQDSVSGYWEYEHDTVLVGQADASLNVQPNQAEICDCAWVTKAELDRRLRESPEKFAPWFVPALQIAW